MLPTKTENASSSATFSQRLTKGDSIPRASLLEPTSIFPREGLSPDVWIGVSESIFQGYLVDDATQLVRTLCNLGAKVAILSKYYHPNNRICATEYVVNAEEKIAQKCQELSAETLGRVARLRALPEIEFGDSWIRDYIGHFGFNLKYDAHDLSLENKLFHLECDDLPKMTSPNYSRGAFDSILQKHTQIGYQKLDLRLVGGATVFLGDDAVLITEEYLRKWAPDSNLSQLQSEFAKIGRPRVIVVPATDTSPSHADTIACQIGDVVYIPELDLQTIGDDPELLKMKLALDSAAMRIELNGFQTERLIIPLPLTPFSSKWMSSPVNLVQIRNHAAEHHVILPWPQSIGAIDSSVKPFGLSLPTNPWRDQERHVEYQEINKSRLLSNGVKSVTTVRVNTSSGGSLHCATCEIPDDAYQIIRDKIHLEKLNFI